MFAKRQSDNCNDGVSRKSTHILCEASAEFESHLVIMWRTVSEFKFDNIIKDLSAALRTRYVLIFGVDFR